MASITKQKNGYRVQISVKGQRDSATFTRKADADAWAVHREAEMRRMDATGVNTDKLVQDALHRYAEEVSVHKGGARTERLRMNAFARIEIDGMPLGKMRLADVRPETIGKWRDYRLNIDKVLGSTVNRDLNLLSNVFTTCVREWKWMAQSPTTEVRRPKDPAPRDRLYTEAEIARLCVALGFDPAERKIVSTGYQRVAVAFLFAIETAMRAGEICAIWPDLVRGRTVHLPAEIVKNGSKRDVPLSTRALDLLALLPKVEPGKPLFGIAAASLDTLFRKAKERALITGATFHDTRHLAITRLAKKFPNVLDLARMTGHKDLRKLQIYYNETAEEMAKLLD